MQTDTSTTTAATEQETARLSIVARVIKSRIPPLQAGALYLTLPNGDRIVMRGPKAGPLADVTFKRWRGLWRLARESDVGLGAAYIDGDWTTPDLRAVMEWGLHNEVALDEGSGSILTRFVNRIRHRKRDNTKRGSRRNIAAHYDLGNAFYRQWLDTSMNYSSALYRRSDETLEDAQRTKLARAAELMDLKGGEKVLEIGIGWGAMARALTREHGCAVTGLTLSAEQLAHAQSPEAAQGADLRLQDYRDVHEKFDRIVSIEMIEAVGETYWPVYFEKLRDSLNRGGVAVLQAITIAEDRFGTYLRRPDFIQKYIFPGGMLPTKELIRAHAERAGLTLVTQEMFGDSYARTLEEWRQRFLCAWPNIEPLGFDARFRRMWEYYLAYCEAGFRFGAVDVGFYKLARAK